MRRLFDLTAKERRERKEDQGSAAGFCGDSGRSRDKDRLSSRFSVSLRSLRCFAVSLILSVGILGPAFAGEERAMLTIKPDGSCLFALDITEPRIIAEQQVRVWERFQKANDNADEDAKPATTAEAKPFTDEQLAAKIRQTLQLRAEQNGVEEDFTEKLEKLEIKTNTVRTVTTQTFATLEEMLKHGQSLWGRVGLNFENVKVEKDSSEHLRLTFIPGSFAQRYAKNMRQQWKLKGAANELKFVFPGKVLTSGFPHAEGNATWLTIDAQKPETLDAASKLYDAPIVITCELGGLQLDKSLESKILQRLARRPSGAPDLPITDAGPGFAAEPLAVTTTTLYFFPGGEKYLQQARAASFGGSQTGTVVSAKLFAPKGRTLQSVSGLRVVKATDDKGRTIAGTGEDDGDPGETVIYHNAGSQSGNSTHISLRLQLPQPDAQSIDELSVEAIALTAGKWKELTLTNITNHSTNEVDLAPVLPGAKLLITKFTSKNRQLSLQARLTGPPAIRQLEIQTKPSGAQRTSSTAYEQSFNTRAGESTRKLQLQQYGFSEEDADSGAGPISLLLRLPEDQRRERVRFVLKGLDLL